MEAYLLNSEGVRFYDQPWKTVSTSLAGPPAAPVVVDFQYKIISEEMIMLRFPNIVFTAVNLVPMTAATVIPAPFRPASVSKYIISANDPLGSSSVKMELDPDGSIIVTFLGATYGNAIAGGYVIHTANLTYSRTLINP